MSLVTAWRGSGLRIGCAVLALTALGWPSSARGAPASPDGRLRDGRIGEGRPAEPAGQLAGPGRRAATGPRASTSGPGAPRLLSVPYLSQEELLCGSAAAAMVMRYWGGRADARHFAHLVDPARHGIGTDALVGELRLDGWRALPLKATAGEVRRQLQAGRPVIALVEDRPDRYHYVVVVAWVDAKVVFHDPAVAPFEVRPETEFLEAWEPAGNWGLLVLPGTDGTSGTSTSETSGTSGTGISGTSGTGISGTSGTESSGTSGTPGTACASLVETGVAAARSGDRQAAERRLGAAVAACPGRPGPLRELAGLRFRQERWADAASLTRRALTLSPDDPYTLRLLAGARFLEGDRAGALEAWNRRGEPRVEAVEIRGVQRTRHPVIADALEIRAERLLSRDGLERARRRLAELPTMDLTHLRYEAPAAGRATVVAAVVERPLLPTSALEIGAAVGHSLARREVSLELAGPTGGGVVWEPWWRWRDGSSGIGLRVDLPAPAGTGGVWSLRMARTRETIGATRTVAAGIAAPGHDPGPPSPESASAPAGSSHRITEVRDHIGIGVSDWSSGRVRWEVGSGWDRWRGRNRYLFLGGSVERRLAGDRIAMKLEGTGWEPLGSGGEPFVKAGGFVAWRSSTAGSARSGWLGTARLEIVGGDAPTTLWPGAGAGEVRQPLLRAHPLLADGTVRADSLGRRLLHATTEYRRRIATLGPVGVIGAGFTDAARTWHPPQSGPAGADAPSGDAGTLASHPSGASLPASYAPVAGRAPAPGRFHVDVGIGLRLRFPGRSGSLRIDLARGLRDGATGLSAGWQVAWPGWQR